MAEEPGARRASALMFALVAFIYPAWHAIFKVVMPSAVDPLGERLAVAALMVAAIVCFRFKALRPFLLPAEQALLFVLTAHYLSLVWRNQMALPYVVGTYVTFAAVSVVLASPVIAIVYSVSCVAAVGVMAALSNQPGGVRLESVLGMATIFAAVGVGHYKSSVTRRAATARIAQGRALLKQIIDTIPDPVFVREADRNLLLTNEAGRRLESATGYDIAAVARQEEEALSAAETLEADADIATNFGALAMSVKTAVTRIDGGPPMLVTIMRDVTDRRRLEESLRTRLRELEEARTRVRQLQGMLPICMHCARIRCGDGSWEALETYVQHNSSASFTHTLCANCLDRHYPQE